MVTSWRDANGLAGAGRQSAPSSRHGTAHRARCAGGGGRPRRRRAGYPYPAAPGGTANSTGTAVQAVQVPQLVGLPQAPALILLQSDGLKVSITAASSIASTGTVLTQRPAAGSNVNPGTTVALTAAAWSRHPGRSRQVLKLCTWETSEPAIHVEERGSAWPCLGKFLPGQLERLGHDPRTGD
jgi:hypothetical protein